MATSARLKMYQLKTADMETEEIGYGAIDRAVEGIGERAAHDEADRRGSHRARGSGKPDPKTPADGDS